MTLTGASELRADPGSSAAGCAPTLQIQTNGVLRAGESLGGGGGGSSAHERLTAFLFSAGDTTSSDPSPCGSYASSAGHERLAAAAKAAFASTPPLPSLSLWGSERTGAVARAGSAAWGSSSVWGNPGAVRAFMPSSSSQQPGGLSAAFAPPPPPPPPLRWADAAAFLPQS
jgi:hypothetical protein